MPKLICKVGVTPANLWIAAALSRIKAPVEALIITAGTDGQHMKNSKHYVGDALDVRSHNFPTYQSKLDFMDALRGELGPDFSVILESTGRVNEHFHIQTKKKPL